MKTQLWLKMQRLKQKLTSVFDGNKFWLFTSGMWISNSISNILNKHYYFFLVLIIMIPIAWRGFKDGKTIDTDGIYCNELEDGTLQFIDTKNKTVQDVKPEELN